MPDIAADDPQVWYNVIVKKNDAREAAMNVDTGTYCRRGGVFPRDVIIIIDAQNRNKHGEEMKMKRLLTVLLALALLAGMFTVPALAESKLLSWKGFEVWVTDYSYKDSDDGYTYIRMDVRIVNDTSHTIWLRPDEVMVDGTTVYGAGVSSIAPGASLNDWLLIKPDDSNISGGDGAIRTGSQIDMTLIVYDNDTYDELYSQYVSINLYDLSVGGGYDYNDDTPADFGFGGAHNYAPAYTPASTNYKTLKQGSKGQAVRDLQQRLTDLGYLNDRVDGAYGRNTNTAVRSFCAQNGLLITSEATPEMQRLLYSSSAQYYEEPYLPLMIAGTFYLETPQQTRVSGVGMMNVEVVNRSSTRGIRGFSLSYYQTDMYGNKIDLDPNGGGQYYYTSEELNPIKAGHYEKAYTYAINYFYSTYAVHVGVQKVVLDNGEVREIDPGDVTYFECVVQ